MSVPPVSGDRPGVRPWLIVRTLRNAHHPTRLTGARADSGATCSPVSGPPDGGLDEVQHPTEVGQRAAHGQVEHQPVVRELQELGEHGEVHIGAERARLALPGQPIAGGGGDRVGPGGPPLGELRVGAQPPGNLELGAEPAGDLGLARRRGRRRWPGRAGRASPAPGRAGRPSRPSRRRRPRRRRGTATPCRGSGGRSRRGRGRSPPRAGGPWRPRTRAARSRPGRRRESAGGGPRAGRR